MAISAGLDIMGIIKPRICTPNKRARPWSRGQAVVSRPEIYKLKRRGLTAVHTVMERDCYHGGFGQYMREHAFPKSRFKEVVS